MKSIDKKIQTAKTKAKPSPYMATIAERLKATPEANETTELLRGIMNAGAKYTPATSRQINRLAKETNPAKVQNLTKSVAKAVAKEQKEINKQHKLLNKRIQEESQIKAQGGQLAPQYSKRLAEISKAYTGQNKPINSEVMKYLKAHPVSRALQESGAYASTINLNKVIQASGAVQQVQNGKLYPQTGAPNATAFPALEPIPIPRKYKESEAHALARFAGEKLEDMRERMSKGEQVRTGRNLDQILTLLDVWDVLDYNTKITPDRQNISLSTLKWSIDEIDERLNKLDPGTREIAENFLRDLAGYELFSEQASETVEHHRRLNRAIASGGTGIDSNAINALLNRSAIYYYYYHNKKGFSYLDSEQIRSELRSFVEVSTATEPYFPPSLIKYTDTVIKADEGPYHPLLDKWVDAVIYVHEQVPALKADRITKEEIDEKVSELIR